jgi:hypothetical protein
LVIVYATCSLGTTFLSPYHPELPLMPALQRFAEQAIVFERHQTESGQSGTAFASIFSGRQADEHGVYFHPTRLPEELLMLTEVFADGGYEVHSFLAHTMASAKLGYAQGARAHGIPLTGWREEVRTILARLRSDPEARVLLVTNLTLTHGPYQALGLRRLCSRNPERCGLRDEPWFERLRQLYVTFGIPLSIDFAATVERLGLREQAGSRRSPRRSRSGHCASLVTSSESPAWSHCSVEIAELAQRAAIGLAEHRAGSAVACKRARKLVHPLVVTRHHRGVVGGHVLRLARIAF